jgi:predicted Fe-Mo cluster-binding NifX family protein
MKTKRIAIPIEQGNLGCRFGLCHQYIVYTIKNDGNINREMITKPQHESTELLEWLKNQGVTDVIAYQIDPVLVRNFIENKMNVFIGAPILSPEKLLDAYLSGNLISDEQVLTNK